MEKRNFNEALKQREAREREENARRSGDNEMTLDDAARVKILSPGRLVFKRFMRNKLALVGSAILIIMFLFAFLGPYFYKYGQTDVFTTYKKINIPYANAKERTEFVVYNVEDQGITAKTKNMFNSIILEMQGVKLDQYGKPIPAEPGVEIIEKDLSLKEDGDGGKYVLVEKQGENIYTMAANEPVSAGQFELQLVGRYFKKSASAKATVNTGNKMAAAFNEAAVTAVDAGEYMFTFEDKTYLVQSGVNEYEKLILGFGSSTMKFAGADLGADFVTAAEEVFLKEKTSVNREEKISFIYEGKLYLFSCDVANEVLTALKPGESGVPFTVLTPGESKTAYVASPIIFDTEVAGTKLSDTFKAQALLAIYGEGKFSADGADYTVQVVDDEISINTADGQRFAVASTFVVRRYDGQDTLDIGFKTMTRDVVTQMQADRSNSGSFTYKIPQVDDDGKVITDAEGNVELIESELTVNNKVTDYVVVCEQNTSMIDRFAAPSDAHILGTDGDGMDIFARMMAGGRVSLLVGFVVVILEIILGVIMGGLAGYFGGWVDNLIMRLVDIFYCIPSMPILIIIGAMLDELRLDPYIRLMWLMAVLGFLGWASIARLVRGQILSLRDQDFMVATEATGLPVRRRIFRHLIPNVMPQLIVTATMGLGSVILTESTLSFLGLGVKHPMATWGTMINSVATSAQSMITYTYIWIPVGLLICLTVVAFNFVGDGLRDAFDPKMKR